jgi:hypothetical protein
MAARPRRTTRKIPCASPAGIQTESAAGSSNCSIFSANMVSIFVSIETFLNSGQAFRLANCQPPHRQTDCRGRHSHLVPPWYCPPLCARSGPDPLGGYCHPSHIGRQTSVYLCSITLSFPPTDRSAPDRLFWWGITGLEGRGSQRQTHGLELAVDHETGETPP